MQGAPFDVHPTAPEANRRVAARDAVLAGLEADDAGSDLDHLDGLSIDGPDWWCDVRPSNTEPVIRVDIGATTRARLDEERGRLWNRIDALAG